MNVYRQLSQKRFFHYYCCMCKSWGNQWMWSMDAITVNVSHSLVVCSVLWQANHATLIYAEIKGTATHNTVNASSCLCFVVCCILSDKVVFLASAFAIVSHFWVKYQVFLLMYWCAQLHVWHCEEFWTWTWYCGIVKRRSKMSCYDIFEYYMQPYDC